MEQLPTEVFLRILYYLEREDLVCLAHTCSLMYGMIAMNAKLWMPYLIFNGFQEDDADDCPLWPFHMYIKVRIY